MPLRDQLADGARLVIPVGPRDQQFLMRVERHGSEWTEWTDGACVFVPLIGLGGFEARQARAGRRSRPAGRRAPEPGCSDRVPASVYSARHDPRLRRAPSRRRRAVVRRPHRQPARARPDRDDPDGLLRRRRQTATSPTTSARRSASARKAMWPVDRGLQPQSTSADWPTARLGPAGPPPRTGSKRPRRTRTPPASGSGSARPGTAGASIRNESLAEQVVIDDVSTQGAPTPTT